MAKEQPSLGRAKTAPKVGVWQTWGAAASGCAGTGMYWNELEQTGMCRNKLGCAETAPKVRMQQDQDAAASGCAAIGMYWNRLGCAGTDWDAPKLGCTGTNWAVLRLGCAAMGICPASHAGAAPGTHRRHRELRPPGGSRSSAATEPPRPPASNGDTAKTAMGPNLGPIWPKRRCCPVLLPGAAARCQCPPPQPNPGEEGVQPCPGSPPLPTAPPVHNSVGRGRGGAAAPLFVSVPPFLGVWYLLSRFRGWGVGGAGPVARGAQTPGS